MRLGRPDGGGGSRRACAAVLGAFLAASAAAADPAVRAAIEGVAADIAYGADSRDWERVRAAMADEVTTDYTSLFGGEPETRPADDLVGGWAAFLPGFDSTHHMVASLVVTGVDGDAATAEANFTATHRIGDALWVLGGRYEYALVRSGGRWLLRGLTMRALWETGDRGLVGMASKRAAGN